MRRTIARRLTESKATVPHFYLSIDCRMDSLMNLRAQINAVWAQKISVNSFVLRAAALALREIPAVNVAWTDTALRHFHSIDIAVAVATDAGLITPILRNAAGMSLAVIAAEMNSLTERARNKQLRADEFTGGSFSVSNLGMHGVDDFAAIINPPQAAILAVGAIRQQPVVQDGQVAVGHVMRCTLAVDHRAVDGALAGAWCSAFRRLLETPLSLLA
jgi:pyruvate dehydrogenase E2 component (dihydrolipoamide acetyltransferase)